MKFVILLALTSAAFGAKLEGLEEEQFHHHTKDDHDVEIVHHIHEAPVGAVYRNEFELSNGISVQETGEEGSVGQSITRGSFKFQTPEGQLVEVFYTADENGFQPQSDAIPQAPEMPAHALEQLQTADRQRAEGIQFDQQGFQI